ncbi:ABC transporter substrate-binding protein [Pseudoroseomonas wenyumeiae]
MLALPLLAGTASAQAETTLRMVLRNDLATIDPVSSTATFARNHGFLVYDQLYALDSKGEPRRQMIGSEEVSADGRQWRFTLRPGLRFHDGAPVRAADAVASIRRWAQRDVVGRALAAATAKMEVVDDQTFIIELSRPFALVKQALARPTASALFVMPEAVAQTPATEQITSAVGSGPFIFERDQWRVGDRATYRRNPDYKPREEAPMAWRAPRSRAWTASNGSPSQIRRRPWAPCPRARSTLGAAAA